MRLQIFSDLHIDVIGGFKPRLADGVDVVVMPGDVCEGALKAMSFLRTHIPRPTPIVYVLGNHEFYRHGVIEERLLAAEAAEKLDIALLDDTALVIGGVRFVGGTLWSDFKLGGEHLLLVNILAARDRMNDYRRISLRKHPWQRFVPETAIELHRRSRTFIEEALAHPFAGPTVVVTHHAPHPLSIHARFDRASINPAYVSDLTEVLERYRPPLWVHGHVHNSFDYRVGETRIVANPHGYGDENRSFDPGLVVEI